MKLFRNWKELATSKVTVWQHRRWNERESSASSSFVARESNGTVSFRYCFPCLRFSVCSFSSVIACNGCPNHPDTHLSNCSPTKQMKKMGEREQSRLFTFYGFCATAAITILIIHLTHQLNAACEREREKKKREGEVYNYLPRNNETNAVDARSIQRKHILFAQTYRPTER